MLRYIVILNIAITAISCAAMEETTTHAAFDHIPNDVKKLIPYALISLASKEKDNFKSTLKDLLNLSIVNKFFRNFITDLMLGKDVKAQKFNEYFINAHHQKYPGNHPIFIAAKVGTHHACIILKDLLEKTFPKKLHDPQESEDFHTILQKRQNMASVNGSKVIWETDILLINMFKQFPLASLKVINETIPGLPAFEKGLEIFHQNNTEQKHNEPEQSNDSSRDSCCII